MNASNQYNWENKNRLGKANARKTKDVVDNSRWKSAMPQDLIGLVDENVFCDMCADLEADMHFFDRSALTEKIEFENESLILLVDQLLSDDSKIVASAAKKLNDLANGNEAISAALRIKLLSTPHALENIFHVRTYFCV